jgi:5-methylcytosine-specific restriction endonuclease McrA
MSAKERYWADPVSARKRQSENRDKARHRLDERVRREKYNLRSDHQVLIDRDRLRPSGYKRCRKCGSELVFSCFKVNRGLPDGLSADCRDCVKLSKNKLERIAGISIRSAYSCVYCSGPYEELDHVMPVKLGGLDVKENLVPACSTCNKKKSSKHPNDWLSDMFPAQDIDSLLKEWGVKKTWQNH